VTLFEEGPERHRARRRIMTRALGGPRLRGLSETTRVISHQVLERPLATGQIEAVAELAEPVTRRAVGSLLGIPRDEQARVFALVAEVQRERLAATTPTRDASLAAVELRSWLVAHAPDDVEAGALARLGDPDPAGFRLSEDEFVMDAQQLCQSGKGATRLLIANLLYRLASDVVLYDRVQADRGLAGRLVEESLRVDAPVRFAKRTCTATTEIAGTTIEAGDEVLMSLASAEAGSAIDLDGRRSAHLAFGAGPHRCPGATVARVIAATVIDVVLDRVAHLRVADDFVYERQPYLDALRFNGPRTLPLELIAHATPMEDPHGS
jgi:cytochrome P450